MSPDPLRRVLLLRSPAEPDPYAAAFAAAGYEATSVPVLTFTFVGREELRDCLERPHSYAGLVLTSPRAVDALAEVLQWLPSETAAWHARPAFTVGPATAAALRDVGFSPEGEDSGSATMLVDYVAGRSFEKPLLFLCGNRRRDVLPEGLRAAGVAFEERCVYETHVRSSLDFSGTAAPAWVVFFSPSGVEAAREAGGLDGGRVRRAAIGETTASALRDAGWPPEAVASEPTPEALVQAIREAEAA